MQNPLVTLREKAGIPSRRALARRMNLSYEILCHYETGLRPRMTDRVVCEISKVLKVEPEKLKGDYKQWRDGLREAA